MRYKKNVVVQLLDSSNEMLSSCCHDKSRDKAVQARDWFRISSRTRRSALPGGGLTSRKSGVIV